jgi:hypothetical protein
MNFVRNGQLEETLPHMDISSQAIWLTKKKEPSRRGSLLNNSGLKLYASKDRTIATYLM